MDQVRQIAVDPTSAWQAVAERHASSAGSFVYAVSTTGVYCLPGCPSRTPLRRNTRFFATAREARAAGFRPCKRCRPDGGLASEPTVDAACSYIESHLDEPLTLAKIGAAVSMSPDHLQRLFTRRTGVSPHEYAQALRVQRFKDELRGGAAVGRAAVEAGFGSRSAANGAASGHLAMAPARYAGGAPGVQIGFALGECSYGTLLVASTERGVCAVTLGDEREALEAALAAEYPLADIAPADDRGHELCGRVVRLAERPREPGDQIPLDVAASAFQWRVWRALQRIPVGERRSYTQVAASIGAPRSARAVAAACAANPAALVIPCHRVVRSDGSLAGYRWGVGRKAAILESEALVSCR